jgi:hypothetical protein
MERSTITDLYFLEARSKLVDLAAFLDRVERAQGEDDHRLRAFRRALCQLAARAQDGGDPKVSRAEEVLLAFSDPTCEPVAQAGGKAATGAWTGVAAD